MIGTHGGQFIHITKGYIDNRSYTAEELKNLNGNVNKKKICKHKKSLFKTTYTSIGGNLQPFIGFDKIYINIINYRQNKNLILFTLYIY